MKYKSRLWLFLLPFIFAPAYAEELSHLIQLNHLALSSVEEIKEGKAESENDQWQKRLSPHVRFDKKNNTFFYKEAGEEKSIVNHLTQDEQYQQAVYLGALNDGTYLFRQESWQSWRLIAISPDINKRVAFNLAEAFVSPNEHALLIINVPLEGCEKNGTLSCSFKLTEYTLNNQSLNPTWHGQINLPNASFVIDPFWREDGMLWLQVMGANNELYHLKMIKE